MAFISMTARRTWWLLLLSLVVIALLPLAIIHIIPSTIGAKSLAAATEPDVEPMNYLPIVSAYPTPTPSCVPPPEIASSDLANEAAIQAGINQRRQQNNLDPLNQDASIVQAARRHSLDMATNNFTNHTGSDGSRHWERMSDACYDADYTGEIIGWGFGGNPSSMITWWMNSPPHKAIILSGNFEDFGAGYIKKTNSEWGHYWTVDFGTPVTQNDSSAGNMYTCTYTVETEQGGSSLILLSGEPCIQYD